MTIQATTPGRASKALLWPLTSAALCCSIMASIDWIAWLALRTAESGAQAAIIGCLSTLALALARVYVVLAREISSTKPRK